MADQTRKELAEAGLKIRREVLGSKHVDNALNNATDFNRPMQELLNEYCWGACTFSYLSFNILDLLLLFLLLNLFK